MTTGPQHYREAEYLAKRAYHYIYGDGGDVQAGVGFAAMAQVHATLAGVAMRFEHARGLHVDEWREALDIPKPKPPATVDGRPIPHLPDPGRLQ